MYLIRLTKKLIKNENPYFTTHLVMVFFVTYKTRNIFEKNSKRICLLNNKISNNLSEISSRSHENKF